MKITDCTWEIANLGKKTCEVIIEARDSIDENFLKELDASFEYLVIKVDPGKYAINKLLEENGFRFIETQIDAEIKYKDFRFNEPLVKYLEPDVSFVDVTEQDGLDVIFERMTPKMFVSDRIAIDPYFGLEFSYKRYSNWIKTAFENKTASFMQLLYKQEHVGFAMYRIKDKIWHGDLGGIYPDTAQGLGLLLVCGSFFYVKQHQLDISKIITSISSNNSSVIPPYNYCHFSFKKFKYVFIKHNDSI